MTEVYQIKIQLRNYTINNIKISFHKEKLDLSPFSFDHISVILKNNAKIYICNEI